MHLKSTLFGLGLFSAACMAANHDIQVGPDLIYSPNTTTTATGDTVTFHFFPGRHNVAQGQYNTPCVDLSGGFYSGFIAPDVGEANETFVVTINDTNPIWFYCTETMHCQLGMAGVINPPALGDNLAAYVAAAKNTTNSTTPAAVAGGVIALNTSASSTTPTSTTPTSSSSSTSSVSPTQTTSEGAVLGGKSVVLNALSAGVAVFLFWCGLV